jgi:hypothetical protein
MFLINRAIGGAGTAVYFDDTDALVAAEYFGDIPTECGGTLGGIYGPAPSCPELQFWRD